MDVREQFGRLLKERRAAQGLTQEELAARAGMSVPYLSDLERGRWNPSLAVLVDLARAFGIQLSELLAGLVLEPDGEPPQRRRPEE